MIVGFRKKRREKGCVFPRPFPCPRIQSPVQREIRVRSRGDQAMVDIKLSKSGSD